MSLESWGTKEPDDVDDCPFVSNFPNVIEQTQNYIKLQNTLLISISNFDEILPITFVTSTQNFPVQLQFVGLQGGAFAAF